MQDGVEIPKEPGTAPSGHLVPLQLVMKHDPNLSGVDDHRLKTIAEDLSELIANPTHNAAHIRVTRESERCFVIRGNTLGLVEFADHILQVAQIRIDGSHSHIDEASLLGGSKSDGELVISYEISEGSWGEDPA